MILTAVFTRQQGSQDIAADRLDRSNYNTECMSLILPPRRSWYRSHEHVLHSQLPSAIFQSFVSR